MGFDELEKEMLEERYALIESYIQKIRTSNSIEKIKEYEEKARRIIEKLNNNDNYKIACIANIRNAVYKRKEELKENINNLE